MENAEIQNWILWITKQGLWFQAERLRDSWDVIHNYLEALAAENLFDYAAFRLCIQLRIPATIDPTIKNVAIAYDPVLTAGIVAA